MSVGVMPRRRAAVAHVASHCCRDRSSRCRPRAVSRPRWSRPGRPRTPGIAVRPAALTGSTPEGEDARRWWRWTCAWAPSTRATLVATPLGGRRIPGSAVVTRARSSASLVRGHRSSPDRTRPYLRVRPRPSRTKGPVTGWSHRARERAARRHRARRAAHQPHPGPGGAAGADSAACGHASRMADRTASRRSGRWAVIRCASPEVAAQRRPIGCQSTTVCDCSRMNCWT